MKKEHGDIRDKFVAINGDMMQPDLGITKSDREMLEREIHVVFHSAATIRFDEPLRYRYLLYTYKI